MTQDTVMNTVSATEVAARLWGVDTPRTAEWLHRSAYSFGGLGTQNPKPDSSQSVENLVFDTFEANTAMIRYEEDLKRNAKDMLIVLFPGPIFNENWGEDSFSWLVQGLHYRWLMGIPETNLIVEYRHKFDVFSRQYPMRFEVELDEGFEDLVAENKDLQTLITLWLCMQALS
ncbi:hypothetical protein F4678DRAFT_337019 [Xylaria arbuscula]|nr:hypothetical protein F4678DRAFT_337019 [Xylaria arbuscula]